MKIFAMTALLLLAVSVHAAVPEIIPKILTSTTTVETVTKATKTTRDNVGPTTPNRVLPGEPPRRKSYLIPALEIPLFQLTLSGADRLIYGDEYNSGLKSTEGHLRRGPWVVDQDDFAVNQIGHPYQGATYYGFARASGLNFWEGLIYSNVGSFIWETAGETSKPSINDQVASGNAGALIGEPLFRMASLVLEGGGDGPPGFWRELGATVISPPTGLNRLLFGERYTPILKSRHAAIFTQIQAGAGHITKVRNPGSAAAPGRNAIGGDFSMAYGLPGQPGYLYLRPFDYFSFEFNTIRETHTNYSNMMVRGLLYGHKYELGDAYQGIWGLYGTFDYYSPQIFRFSTTAASFGSTFQWWMSRRVALQGTALAGLGYGAAGTITPKNDEADFHYGAAPQGLLALRMIFGRRAVLDTTARGYYVTGTGASKANGTEMIARLNSSFYVRLFGRHAVGINYLLTSREAHYADARNAARHQLVETIGVAYNLLGNASFGAVNVERD
jgi:hypothetical protein